MSESDLKSTESPVAAEASEESPPIPKDIKRSEKPFIISMLAGKGGVGQSMLAANLGVYLAQTGKKVLLVDAVRWNQNLHTFLDIPNPPLSLDVLKDNHNDDIQSLIIETPYQKLKLLCGIRENTSPNSKANCPFLIEQARKMPFDFIILDLGSHLSFNMLDHALSSDFSVLTTVPEPTAVESTYELLRAMYFRLFKTVEQKLGTEEVVEKAMLNSNEFGINTPKDLVSAIGLFSPEKGKKMAEEIARFKIKLLVNQVRSNTEGEIGESISSVSKKYFGINLDFIGFVDFDNLVPASVRQKKPLHLIQKESNVAKQIEDIAHKLVRQEIIGKQEQGEHERHA